MGKVGRPSRYEPEHCDKAIEVLSQGHSVAGLAGAIGVSRQAVYDWIKQFPDFAEAVKVGQAGATYTWEAALMKVAKEGGGNATACIFGVKNRASEEWSDKVVQEHTGAVQVNVAGADADLL